MLSGEVKTVKTAGSIETERKFLIKFPEAEALAEASGSEIEQIYLSMGENSEFDNERIRKRIFTDRTVYTHTGKKRISDMSAVEDEREITREEYEKLSAKKEDGAYVLTKKRYVLPYRGFDFEIDVYPFWSDRAVMEVELPGEDTKFEIPPMISIVKEVTGDKRYSNHALSHGVPNEDV